MYDEQWPRPVDTANTKDMIRRMLQDDRRYRVTEFGPMFEDRSAVVYSRRDDKARTRVFVTFADRDPVAYVTLPDEPEPLYPDQVMWYWTEPDADNVLIRWLSLTELLLNPDPDKPMTAPYPQHLRVPGRALQRYMRMEK